MSQRDSKLSRRTLFAGAATAGALGAAATLLAKAPLVQAPVPQARPLPEAGGGYQLSEHVQKYYKSTRI
jgi:hypothetical protein